MKDDANKILSRTLITYLIILCITVIMKLNGLDYFGLDMNNKIIVNIDIFIENFHLELLWYAFTLYLYTYIILSISCFDKSKNMKLYTLSIIPFCILIQILKTTFNIPFIFIFTDLLWLFLLEIVYIKFVRKDNIEKYNISNYWIFSIMNIIFQFMSVIIRNVDVYKDIDNFLMSIICNFDYILLSIISYKLFFGIGGKSLWDGVVGLYSHLQTLLKDSLERLRRKLQNKPKKSKVDCITDIIYFPLYLLWNVFTLAVVIFIAFLNDTPIECIIMLISFWLNKTAFGKPFHMKSALSCFMVSNISYYCLNRITFSVGISLLISIVLGILLNYVTSFFVKKNENKFKLYRGMPLTKFDTIMYEVTNLNSIDYEICKMFYVDNYSEIKIASKLNYSISTIQKRRYKMIKIIKELI